MSALDILSQLDDSHIAQISQQIGADPVQTRQAIQAAAPLMVAGVAQTAQQPQGQDTVQQAFDSHGSVLDNIGQVLRGGGAADFGGVLDRVLGRSKPEVQDGVQKNSGLNSDQTKRLLAMLAPLVLGMLAKRRSQSNSQAPIDNLRNPALSSAVSASGPGPGSRRRSSDCRHRPVPASALQRRSPAAACL